MAKTKIQTSSKTMTVAAVALIAGIGMMAAVATLVDNDSANKQQQKATKMLQEQKIIDSWQNVKSVSADGYYESKELYNAEFPNVDYERDNSQYERESSTATQGNDNKKDDKKKDDQGKDDIQKPEQVLDLQCRPKVVFNSVSGQTYQFTNDEKREKSSVDAIDTELYAHCDLENLANGRTPSIDTAEYRLVTVGEDVYTLPLDSKNWYWNAEEYTYSLVYERHSRFKDGFDVYKKSSQNSVNTAEAVRKMLDVVQTQGANYQLYQQNNKKEIHFDVQAHLVKPFLSSFGFDPEKLLGLKNDQLVRVGLILNPQSSANMQFVFRHANQQFAYVDVMAQQRAEVLVPKMNNAREQENIYVEAMGLGLLNDWNKTLAQKVEDPLRWMFLCKSGQDDQGEPEKGCDDLKKVWDDKQCTCEEVYSNLADSHAEMCYDIYKQMINIPYCDPCGEQSDPEVKCSCSMIELGMNSDGSYIMNADGTYEYLFVNTCLNSDGSVNTGTCDNCAKQLQYLHACDPTATDDPQQDDPTCTCDHFKKDDKENIVPSSICVDSDGNLKKECIDCMNDPDKMDWIKQNCFGDDNDDDGVYDCADSDGGVVPLLKGHVDVYTDHGNFEKIDQCIKVQNGQVTPVDKCDDCELLERLCDQKVNYTKLVSCPYGCENGACIIGEDDLPDDTGDGGADDPGDNTAGDDPADDTPDNTAGDQDLPNLIVESIDDKDGIFSAKIMNVGTVDVPADAKVHTYFYIDGAVDYTYANETWNCQDWKTANGGMCTITPTINLTGEHTLEVCTDVKDVVVETKESDNCYKVTADLDNDEIIKVIPTDSDPIGDGGSEGDDDLTGLIHPGDDHNYGNVLVAEDDGSVDVEVELNNDASIQVLTDEHGKMIIKNLLEDDSTDNRYAIEVVKGELMLEDDADDDIVTIEVEVLDGNTFIRNGLDDTDFVIVVDEDDETNVVDEVEDTDVEDPNEETSNVCSDSDNGQNYVQYGWVNDFSNDDYCVHIDSGVRVDECFAGDPNCMLKEQYCDGDTATNEDYDCEAHGLPPCFQGACQEQEAPTVDGPEDNPDPDTNTNTGFNPGLNPGGDF